MTLIKWGPFDDLLSIQEKMNKLFEDTLIRSGGFGSDEEFSITNWMPPVDIYETEDNIILKAELPEISREDVEINVDNNVLTLSGSREMEKNTEKENFHRVERSYGSFKRSFTLPSTIDQDNIDATFENGVLTITMAKRDDSKSRQIEIKSK